MQADSRGEGKSTRRGCTSGLPIARAAGRYARFLKSDARLNRCDGCFARFRMKADEIEAEIRNIAAQRRLPKTHLERWLAMDDASRGAFLTLARKLGLRTGQIVSALELLEEIAVREKITAAEVIGRDEIRRAADARGSAPARASAFI